MNKLPEIIKCGLVKLIEEYSFIDGFAIHHSETYFVHR